MTKPKANTASKTAPETEYERELRFEEVFLDSKIQDLYMNIAYAEILVTTLTRIREDMIEARARLEQYNRVGRVRDSWMLPPPARRDER